MLELKRYKVTVNWFGQIITHYTHASKESRALWNMCHYMHKEGFSTRAVLIHTKLMDESNRQCQWEIKHIPKD